MSSLPRKYKKLTEFERSEILLLYEEGVFIKVIAHEFGVDQSYPSLLAKRCGLKLRGNGNAGKAGLSSPLV